VPWLAEPSQAGVHRINVVAGGGEPALISQRTRLMLRVLRQRVSELAPLQGAVLDVGGYSLRLGTPPVVRELLPWGTLYAHVVATADDDELAFLETIEGELDAMHVPCRRICGRRQVIDDGGRRLTGFSLMLDGLSPADSLRLLESGLGRHRRLGCGMFVPHKSAAALRL
jgi:CRISPR-associated protein Cas6